MSANTNSIYDNIFYNLKDYDMKNNILLQIALRQTYISGMYEFQDSMNIISGKFLENFKSTFGLSEVELIKSFQLNVVNIHNFLSNIFDNMKKTEADYEILIIRKNDNLVEIIFIQDYKLFIIEFLHRDDKFIENIYVIKNDLFDSDTYDLFVKKVISENYIDFTL